MDWFTCVERPVKAKLCGDGTKPAQAHPSLLCPTPLRDFITGSQPMEAVVWTCEVVRRPCLTEVVPPGELSGACVQPNLSGENFRKGLRTPKGGGSASGIQEGCWVEKN